MKTNLLTLGRNCNPKLRIFKKEECFFISIENKKFQLQEFLQIIDGCNPVNECFIFNYKRVACKEDPIYKKYFDDKGKLIKKLITSHPFGQWPELESSLMSTKHYFKDPRLYVSGLLKIQLEDNDNNLLTINSILNSKNISSSGFLFLNHSNKINTNLLITAINDWFDAYSVYCTKYYESQTDWNKDLENKTKLLEHLVDFLTKFSLTLLFPVEDYDTNTGFLVFSHSDQNLLYHIKINNIPISDKEVNDYWSVPWLI